MDIILAILDYVTQEAKALHQSIGSAKEHQRDKGILKTHIRA
jgi:hypothetical protein